MHDLTKRIATLSLIALAVAAPIALTSPSAAAAPLPGEGSIATAIHKQAAPPVEDVYWRRHYYHRHWGGGALFAGAALGLLGGALAASANEGYCDPYYNYCGGYPGGYPGGDYAYYPGSA